MPQGAITEYIDVAQLVLYAFWVFFAGLVYYLHRENKREGYPLESERSPHIVVQGFPAMPLPKTYLLRNGSTVSTPRSMPPPVAFQGQPAAAHPGAPLLPVGDPMTAGVGPGAYAQRADVPDKTIDDTARIVPLRAAGALGVAMADTDPRGLPVLGCDGGVGGTVRELWVDRSEMLFRYLELTPAGGGANVLLPVNFARIGRRDVRVRSIRSDQFAGVPRTRDADTVTMLEEEKIMAYYGAGTLYATPSRSEPLL